MRLRNKPWAEDKLKEYPQYVVDSPKNWAGKWDKRFESNRPMHIEIGIGKGQFIIEMAKQYPDVNFVGIELQTSVLVKALEKQIDEKLANVQFLQGNAEDLRDYFEPGEVEHIYLTFSDPWPKNRHEKRRLTYKNFLTVYNSILSPNGQIEFKTDNRKLFEYSVVSFSSYGMKIKNLYLDLHNSEVDNNVMTEFEEKYSKNGNRIYKTVATF